MMNFPLKGSQQHQHINPVSSHRLQLFANRLILLLNEKEYQAAAHPVCG